MSVTATSNSDSYLTQPRLRAKIAFERRQARREVLPAPLFSEYGWDILLLLFADESSSAQKVTRLAERVKAPMTTAVRWIDYLEQKQLVERNVSELDRREVLISLTAAGRNALMAYFGTAQELAVE